MIYLIHFKNKFWHAQHYLGYCNDREGGLEARMERHSKGRGSKLMRAVTQAGIAWHVARVWPNGTRDEERVLKNKKKSRLLCPVCSKKEFS